MVRVSFSRLRENWLRAMTVSAFLMVVVLTLSAVGATHSEARLTGGPSHRSNVAQLARAPSSPFGGSDGGIVAIRTDDSRAFNNSLLESRFVLPAHSSVSDGGLVIWLVEPFTETQEIGVGVSVNVSDGSESAVAEWGSWNSGGASTVHVNRSLSVSPGAPAVLSIVDEGGDEWSLAVNGQAVPSGQGGLLDLGVSVADGVPIGGASELPEPVPAVVTTSSGPFPFGWISWTEGFGVGSDASPVAVGDGYVETSGTSWGVQGQDQLPGGGPDEFNESASLPVLANGTYVWGIGNTNFPPVAAWTSTDPSTFSTPGGALEVTVPGGQLPSGSPVGICQELLEPLANGRWLTVGVCWDDGVGVRAYAAVTLADGAAYQEMMYVSLPHPGQEALLAVRDVGHGVWQASINGLVMVDASGNSSIVGGADLGNASMGPYGALRGYPSSALPTFLTYSEGILVYRNLQDPSPFLPPEGRIADSDARFPALVQGHLQNSSLPPGAIQVFPGRTPLPVETPLWGATPTSPSSDSWWTGLHSDTPLLLGVLVLAVSSIAATLYVVFRRTCGGQELESMEPPHAPSRRSPSPEDRGGGIGP